MDRFSVCPCGSSLPYSDCCESAHRGTEPTTAEGLMRSRYSAFALSLDGYLLSSWHPTTRPARLDLGETVWRRLQIVDAVAGGEGDETGIVEFRAAYRDDDGAGLLHERSRFQRVDGAWRYLDGQQLG